MFASVPIPGIPSGPSTTAGPATTTEAQSCQSAQCCGKKKEKFWIQIWPYYWNKLFLFDINEIIFLSDSECGELVEMEKAAFTVFESDGAEGLTWSEAEECEVWGLQFNIDVPWYIFRPSLLTLVCLFQPLLTSQCLTWTVMEYSSWGSGRRRLDVDNYQQQTWTLLETIGKSNKWIILLLCHHELGV